MRISDLVAHRGYPRHYPENTRVGIEAALDLGAHYVEFDVQLTADRIPVLFHDRTLDRVCGVPGSIHELTLDQVRELPASEPGRLGDAFAGEGVPTLEEVSALMEEHPRTTFFVEIKSAAAERFGPAVVVERVLDVLGDRRDRRVLISSAPEVLAEARRVGWGRQGLILRTWDQRVDEETRRLDPEVLLCNVTKLPATGDLSLPAARLAVYDVIEPGLASSLVGRGVALVETFAIGEMLAHFQRDEPAP